MTDVTFRLVCLASDCDLKGDTALTPDLARLVPGGLNNPEIRKNTRLGIEHTDWTSDRSAGFRSGPRPARNVLIEAESRPGEWTIGADPQKADESGTQGFFKKRAIA